MSEPTFADVKAVVIRMVNECNRDLAVRVLENCGVAKASQLPENEWAGFIRYAEAAIEQNKPKRVETLGDLLRQAIARGPTLKAPITEQARSPYFAEALGEKPDTPAKRADHAANLSMIARDGPARPAAPVVIQETAKTSHGPIAGLTVVAAVDHRFGGHAFHSS